MKLICSGRCFFWLDLALYFWRFCVSANCGDDSFADRLRFSSDEICGVLYSQYTDYCVYNKHVELRAGPL